MNKRISIVALPLVSIMLSTGVKSASLTFTESLKKYCIPTSSNICGSTVKASYNTLVGACECSQCGMYYDQATRTCKSCASGTYVENRYSTECKKPSCPSGTRPEVTVGVDTCPAGYRRNLVMSCK